MKKYFIILVILLLGVSTFFILTSDKKNKEEPKDKIMINLVGHDINELDKLLKDFNFNIKYSYIYSDDYAKDKIISQSIKEGNVIINESDLLLEVSKGKLDKEKLKNDGIDEMGKVPVMMYHGIVNKKNSETAYTGGNVDKDGYSRTSEAFYNDLELFYQKGYRMISLKDYINGNISTEYGKSPIVLTFDDGNKNNILVKGLDENGNIIIDENSAVGILEQFKKKYPDYNVTATFFVTGALFNQPEYNEKILNWLVDNGYDIGNHTKTHLNIGKSDASQVQSEIAYVYKQLDGIIPNKYVKIIALPFGSPTNKSNDNFKYVLNGTSGDYQYETIGALRVGWEPEISSYNKDFDKTYIKRCRAYDNNGKEFDIEMILKMLDKTKFVSDGNANTIVSSVDREEDIIETDKEIILY